MNLTALEGVRAILKVIGENPDREGLRDTPERVVKALMEMTRGIEKDPAAILSTTFEAGNYDQVIVVAPIHFTSLCEHHLLPFTGHAAVAYLPAPEQEGETVGYRVVGLSKIPRLVDIYARRLQLQERMTKQIADALVENLRPRGVAVLVRAEHACMSCRGVRKTGTKMITSALHGQFSESHKSRSEVFSLINGAW